MLGFGNERPFPMRVFRFLVAVSLALPAAAQDLKVAGHGVALVLGTDGTSSLMLDGEAILTDGLVLLDEMPLDVAGVAVVTGLAGPGGNACGAAPFVLTLPSTTDPVLHGPLDTCAWLEMLAGPAALVFTGVATPQAPAEVWVWAPETGFVAGAPIAFAADSTLGWDRLADLDGEHPMEALRLGQVEAQLKAALGADWPAFAERISGLGSGTLTADGYLGEACIKETCDEDWAVLYLHARSRSAFALWAVGREVQIVPPDPGLWPEEAAAALATRSGG